MIVMSLTLILGLGACAHDGDWCVGHPGKVAVEHELNSWGRHSVNANLEHVSDHTDGTFFDNKRGDRGVDTLFIEYRYRIF